MNEIKNTFLEIIRCAGCTRTAKELKANVQDLREDNTYANGYYVCGPCFMRLVEAGKDLGTPEELQKNAALLRLRQ